jgi:hypothetical protein
VSHSRAESVVSHCPCMLRASENSAANTHIIIIIIRRNFNNQSLPLLTTATAASLLVNYYKKAQHPQIETMRRAHKTNRPEPEIAKSSTDARTRRAHQNTRGTFSAVGVKGSKERERKRGKYHVLFSPRPFCVHITTIMHARKYIIRVVRICSRWLMMCRANIISHYFPHCVSAAI